jgi:hypothetical protein
MLEHPLAVFDLAPAEPAGVSAVQARRMSFEPHAFEGRGAVLGPGASRTQGETNDHEDDDNRIP